MFFSGKYDIRASQLQKIVLTLLIKRQFNRTLEHSPCACMYKKMCAVVSHSNCGTSPTDIDTQIAATKKFTIAIRPTWAKILKKQYLCKN